MKFEAHIEAAVLATTLLPKLSFSWFGKSPPTLPHKLRRSLTPAVARQCLVASLQQQLYSNFYCRGFASPVRWENSDANGSSAGLLTEQLTKANRSCGYWSSGWSVASVRRSDQSHSLVRASDGLRILVPKSELLLQGDRSVGAPARVRFPKDLAQASPGFIVATSNRELGEDWNDIVRLYWNTTPQGAVALMLAATEALNGDGARFRLKALKDPAEYFRCDSVVLYLRASDLDNLRPVIQHIYNQIYREMHPGTPVFTKTLVAGLGLAENPPGGESFGMHRCGLLAAGLVTAHEAQQHAVAERVRTVLKSFEEASIRVTQPFLNPGSADRYPPFELPDGKGRKQRSSQRYPTPLEIAAQIGEELCKTAIWHMERCTWLTPSWRDPTERTLSTLGPELYDGLAGVALFLGHLYKATGERSYALASKGALRQAQRRLKDIPRNQRHSLYSGWVGIALAEQILSPLLRDDIHEKRARQLAHDVLEEDLENASLDLVNGLAGGILGLLELGTAWNDERLLDAGKLWGQHLLKASFSHDHGLSWPTINSIGEYHLTGFSHGAAGIAFALLELAEVTDCNLYRRTARRAFDYEQQWFDSGRNNWPDLRETQPTPRPNNDALAFSSYWCHGAPGIALSRLRAWHYLGPKPYESQTRAAIGTTIEAVSQTLGARSFSFGLCHGVVGNTDILLTTSRALAVDTLDVAQLIESAVFATHQHRQDFLGCLPSGERLPPGLMTGLAGLGWFLLRVECADIPSVLNGFRPDSLIGMAHRRTEKNNPLCGKAARE